MGKPLDICPKTDQCEKVAMVMDKDLAGDWQYAEVIRAVCARCTDRPIYTEEKKA